MEEITKFSFFRSFWEGLVDLPAIDRLAMYDAITAYAFTGNEPKFSGLMNTAWKLAKPNIDSSIRGQETGGRGGRPTKKQPVKTGGNENENPPLKPPVKTTQETNKDMDKDKDRDMEMDTVEIDPLDQSISTVNAPGDAAAADAAPPAAKTIKCPKCDGYMTFDAHCMSYSCQDCQEVFSVAELAGFKPGTKLGHKSTASPSWVCPACGEKVVCDKTDKRICPTHGVVEAVICDV